MRAFGLTLFFLLVLLAGRTFAQQQDSVFSDIHEALMYPDKTENIYLDGDNNDDSLFCKNISKFKNLKSVYLINGKVSDFAETISSFTNLQQLYITSSPDIDFAELFDNLSSLNSLKILSINGCNINHCPKEIRKIKSLQTLVITDNDEFDTGELIKNIAKLPNLKTLALPINQITDLPTNIGLLKQIEVLDISNNWLTDLPDEMPGMVNLKNLDVSGNIIISPVNSLSKLKSLNIRYLNLDKGLTTEEKEKLSALFPNAQITENNVDFIADSLALNNSLSDSTTSATKVSDAASTDKRADSLSYGTFNVQKNQFKIFSLAYLHYAAVFNTDLFKNTFDSLLFDERYLDTNYSNVFKLKGNALPRNFQLHGVKNSKHEIWFDFFYSKRGKGLDTKYISKWNYELNSFKGMVWVYTGNLTRRQFNKNFLHKGVIRGGLKFWKSGYLKPRIIYWNDVRLYYNQADQNFVIELKDKSGFQKINTYPRLPDEKTSIDKAQKQYTKRYAKYLSVLNKRRIKFQNGLLKEKALYDAALKKSISKTWQSFQDMYMSADEKKLSMAEWLEYYDQVVANEKNALYNADATVSNIVHSLESQNYLEVGFSKLIPGDTTLNSVNSFYKDEDQNLLVVSKILLINSANKTFCRYDGSLGLDPSAVILSSSNPVSIVLELRNGDIGVLQKDKYPKDKLNIASEYTFIVKRISKKLASIGQIMDLLNL
jgi:hypothetical protein